MQDSPGLAEIVWKIADSLLGSQMFYSAVKLIYFVHTYGTLKNFCPLAKDLSLHSPVCVSLQDASLESSVLILLAWSLDLLERFHKHGISFEGKILLHKRDPRFLSSHDWEQTYRES